MRRHDPSLTLHCEPRTTSMFLTIHACFNFSSSAAGGVSKLRGCVILLLRSHSCTTALALASRSLFLSVQLLILLKYAACTGGTRHKQDGRAISCLATHTEPHCSW